MFFNRSFSLLAVIRDLALFLCCLLSLFSYAVAVSFHGSLIVHWFIIGYISIPFLLCYQDLRHARALLFGRALLLLPLRLFLPFCGFLSILFQVLVRLFPLARLSHFIQIFLVPHSGGLDLITAPGPSALGPFSGYTHVCRDRCSLRVSIHPCPLTQVLARPSHPRPVPRPFPRNLAVAVAVPPFFPVFTRAFFLFANCLPLTRPYTSCLTVFTV